MATIKIKVVEDTDDYGDRSQTLLMDDVEILSVCPLYECPEDAIIGRDLVDCDDIQGWIEYGYDAAKNGDELIFD